MSKRIILLLSAALLLGATALPAAARVDLNIDIGVPPPAPVYEAVPPPRVGFVWAPGYWGWGPDGRHVWIRGRWIGDVVDRTANHPTCLGSLWRWHRSRKHRPRHAAARSFRSRTLSCRYGTYHHAQSHCSGCGPVDRHGYHRSERVRRRTSCLRSRRDLQCDSSR